MQEIQGLIEQVGASKESLLEKSFAKLTRAKNAFANKENLCLFRGYLLENIPEGIRRFLIRSKQLSAEKAKLSSTE